MHLFLRFLFIGNDDDKILTIKYSSIKAQTGKAYLIMFPDNTSSWLPKSQIKLKTKTNEIKIPKWLAREKGITTE